MVDDDTIIVTTKDCDGKNTGTVEVQIEDDAFIIGVYNVVGDPVPDARFERREAKLLANGILRAARRRNK